MTKERDFVQKNVTFLGGEKYFPPQGISDKKNRLDQTND